MSKMPAKKKSCFQITSVTQAQVAANSIADGTQSLDDPDASRAEIGCCDTLNNVGEPHEGTVNGGLSYSKGNGGRLTPHNAGGSVSAAATVAHTSCGSRFRVIKLDHGTGEPFRRGRWSCTEFYEKDSESSVSRTVDTSIKPAAAATFDPSIEKDSGLGANNGSSVVTSSAFSIQVSENNADSGYSVSAEALHQGYSLPPQIGSGASAFQPTGFMSASQQAQVSVHPAGPQTFLTNSLNGVHQVAMSPIIAAATQPQQLGYSTHAHTDYHQHHFGSSIQNSPMASLTVGSPPANQLPSPAITPGAASGVQGLNGDAAQPQILQVGNSPAVTPVPGIVQHQPSGGSSITTASSISTMTAQSGSQSVPAKVPSSSSPPTGLLNQVPATLGALVQAQGAHGGPATVTSNQPEDGRLKINALTQHSAAMVSARDGVKPLLSDGLSLPTPAVNSLFGIHITMNVDDDSASGASVVAIDNKIEQAMDLVKSHLMYAVREEVEVMKEQIKELYERNSVLERENAVLKSLANSEQLNQLSSQVSHGSTSPPLQLLQHPFIANNMGALAHQESGQQSIPHQPNITSA